MANPQMPNMPGAAAMTDTLEFVKNLWGSVGVPGLGTTTMAAPSLSVEDLDKKINDLKAVEAWLNVNMSMLRGTIQTLEIQRGTIATLKSMGASMAAAVNQTSSSEKSLFESVPYAAAFFQAAMPGAAAAAPASTPGTAAGTAGPADGASGTATQMPNPAAWWNLLQDQFSQAVKGAMQPEPNGTKPAEGGAEQRGAAGAEGSAPGTTKRAEAKRPKEA